MKAIARLGSLIIEAQAFINTADSTLKNVVYSVVGIGIAASIYTKNYIPFLTTYFSAGIGWKVGMSSTKKYFDKKLMSNTT